MPRLLARQVGEDEQQVGLARNLAVDGGLSVALARSSREATQLDLELEGVAGSDLTPEASPVDATEKRKLLRKPLVGKNGAGPELGQRLDHEHTRQRRHAWEMPGEEGLVTAQAPKSTTSLARDELGDLIDEQEGVTMRDQRRGVDARHDQSARALISLIGVSLGEILYQTSASLPFSSIRNAERTMPM